MMKNVIKRDGTVVPFNRDKIYNAIMKAMKYGSGIVNEKVALTIAYESENLKDNVTIYEIEDYVFNRLIEYGERLTAKSYTEYKAIQSFKRRVNTTDDKILGLLNGSNQETIKENSNKNAKTVGTQRDLIAGEVSKDIVKRKIIPSKIVQAHDEGIIHWHDMDYTLQDMPNCCLVNLKDMLDNGTCINGTKIDSPHSFSTACTIATQIMAQVASGQYGGQTMTTSHLAPYVRRSEEKFRKLLTPIIADKNELQKAVESMVKQDIEKGVQTIQYQINTLNSTNGQSPFVSLFLYLNEDEEFIKENAMIIEEILRQRYMGTKNKVGAYITPTFPKLLYVLDENNVPLDSEYRYLTDLACKTTSKRMNPDYISAKKMKENYEGYVFPCMGE